LLVFLSVYILKLTAILYRGGSRKFRKRGLSFGKDPYTGMWEIYEIFWEYAMEDELL
jgi:hypothetical protein